jgi:hypothetical protein
MKNRTLPSLPALAAALFFLLPCPAAAQEEPEAVYRKFHSALIAGNIDELNKYGTPGGAAELAKLPAEQRKGVLDLMKKFIPPSYTITARQPGTDANRLTLRARGMGTSLFGGKPEAMDGEIVMVKMGGEWKVDKSNWNSGKSGATPPRAADAAAPMQSAPQRLPVPSRSAAPKAPERSMGAAKEPCVYKPVMTNEDMERCR